MASLNLSQLRNTRLLKASLRAGKPIELLDGNQPIGRILPEVTAGLSRKWPDFGTRRNKIFGDRLLPGSDLVIGKRGRF